MKLAKAFSLVEEKYYQPNHHGNNPFEVDFPKKAKEDFEQAIGVVLTDSEFHTLHQHDFSFSVCNNLVLLVYAAFNADIMAHDEYQKLDERKHILVRDNRTQTEEERKNLVSVLDQNDIDSYLQRPAAAIFGQGKQSEELRNTALSLIRKLIQPNLTFNRSATEKRRQLLLDQFKPVFFQVQKNEIIAKAGEKLTPGDLNKLEFYSHGSRRSGVRKVATVTGIFLTIFLLGIVFYSISRKLIKTMDRSNVDLLFLSVVFLLQVLLLMAGIFISESISNAFSFISIDSIFFALPFAVSTLLVAVFLNRSVAFIYAVFSSFYVIFLFEPKIPMYFYSFLGSAVSAYHIIYFKQRSAFFKSGLFAGAINTIVIVCMSLLAANLSVPDLVLRMILGLDKWDFVRHCSCNHSGT